MQLNGSGLTVQASPLNRALKGAISFDNLQGVTLNKGANRVLYASETAARAVGSQIMLRTYDASKLSAGMPLRYLGIDVGRRVAAAGAGAQRSVGQSGAVSGICAHFRAPGQPLLDRFAGDLAAGVSNLDTLLQPYINVEPGRGRELRTFELQQASITDSRYLDGLSVVLDAAETGSLQIGTPVLFRGVEVGTITGFYLGAMSDRVTSRCASVRNISIWCATTACSGWLRVTTCSSA